MNQLSYGADARGFVKEGTDAANYYFESAATPESIGSVIRGSILIRRIDQPIQFPFGYRDVVDPTKV